MKKLVLIGAGGHCKSCIDVILQTEKYKIIAILGKPDEIGKSILNYTINGIDNDIEKYIPLDCEFLITVGQIESVKTRLKLYQTLQEHNASLATVVSPLAYVSDYSKIGAGSIIMHQALVNANVSIGNNCIINSKALIEHDSIIEDHCHISTAAIINGHTHIKAGTFVGSNATTKQDIIIDESTFIKAGSLFRGN